MSKIKKLNILVGLEQWFSIYLSTLCNIFCNILQYNEIHQRKVNKFTTTWYNNSRLFCIFSTGELLLKLRIFLIFRVYFFTLFVKYIKSFLFQSLIIQVGNIKDIRVVLFVSIYIQLRL